ncbi:hypothetical protein [Paracoccus pacificus]|uniref:YcxB-like protein n=1 Tax=Paracoccus pacificus TaxID=1463598 RepID=A0ABW4R4M9_9RHOB
MNRSDIIVSVKEPAKWFFSQFGQLVIAVGLTSLVFNYAYRFAVDWDASGFWFYAATLVLALITFVAFRRDYISVNRYAFSPDRISVSTLLGTERTYPTESYRWVPSLHKTVNFPEKPADLSFYVQDIKTGRNLRNYAWKGFPVDEFKKVSKLYGYRGETDFKQKDFGRS